MKKILDFDLTVWDCGDIRVGEEWNYKNITSPFNRIYFLLEGECDIIGENGPVHLTAGQCCLIPANREFSYCCTGSMHKIYFHFNLEMLSGFDLFDDCDEIVTISCPRQEVEPMALMLENLSLKNQICLKGYLQQFLPRFLSDKASAQYACCLYHDIIRLMQENLSGRFRVSGLSQNYCGNFYELSRKFKKDMGLTLKQYHERLLLREIQRILVNTDRSVREIAEQFCFCDAYYLSRFFKQKTGFTPTQYREQNRQFQYWNES